MDTKTTEVLDMVVMRLRTKFRRRATRRLGEVWKQKNKQTFIYILQEDRHNIEYTAEHNRI